MKKIEFNTGDRVVTVVGGELRKGVIKNFYPVNPPVFAIEFEDGTVEKIPYSNVAPEPKVETQGEKNEPVVKSEITITPDEFKDITCPIITEMTKRNVRLGFETVIILSKVYRTLFVEPWEND